jgi:hypothetical protein
MYSHRFIALLLVVGVASLCGAATEARSSSVTIAECAEDLQLPHDGPPGNPGDRIGPITVTVTPDARGRPASITMAESSSPASMIIRSWVSGSTFAKKCAGKELVLQFSFATEGPAQEYPFSWVTFHGPNHFIIHSRARIPTVLGPAIPLRKGNAPSGKK